jgi:hypothetical protein
MLEGPVIELPVWGTSKAWESRRLSLIGQPAKGLRRLVLSRVRAANRGRLLDNLKISIAVNRGLCVVAVLFVLVEKQRVTFTGLGMGIVWWLVTMLIFVGVLCSRLRYAKLLKDRTKFTLALRALALVAVLGLAVTCVPSVSWSQPSVQLLAAGIVVAVASGARACRYTMQFEREIWVQFGEISSADFSAGGSNGAPGSSAPAQPG